MTVQVAIAPPTTLGTINDSKDSEEEFKNVFLNVNNVDFGEGSLYFYSDHIIWISYEKPDTLNITSNYYNVILHAICKDEEHPGRSSLYCQFDVEFDLVAALNGQSTQESDNESLSSQSQNTFAEVRFIPSSEEIVGILFKKFCTMSSLNPDIEQETSGDYTALDNHNRWYDQQYEINSDEFYATSSDEDDGKGET
ncbi:uncharacterized protein LOC128884101 [Hylaeus volcanicus]|uniref:uncharacterized protein LOC128884101 n=1 Tax=Hylaeus volcanicus TaxID=313075 RepID=UPI0023B7DEBA|nr:uncharacterized protein LOC128884101 [Hylaeus volcanicus]